jgi:hypothetical protein
MSAAPEAFAAGDPDTVKKAIDRKKLRDRNDADDLCAVLNLPAGRRFLRRLLAETRPLGSSFNPDPATYGHNEGVRSVGIAVEGWIERADPSALADVLLGKPEG